MLEKLRGLRSEAASGPGTAPETPLAAFDLPWPWGGERFELHALPALTYLVGPLFSGKTKLAQRLAETLPGAAFVGLDRQMEGVQAEGASIEQALARLTARGAIRTEALCALLAALEAEGPEVLVVDLWSRAWTRRPKRP